MNITILTPDPADIFFIQNARKEIALFDPPLHAIGIKTEYQAWTNNHDCADADLVLPLLIWGYHKHPLDWAARLDTLETAGAKLANPAAILRWNIDKRYLLELQEKGAPIIPTRYSEAVSQDDIAHAAAQFGTTDIIAKPIISAGAHGIIRITPDDRLPDTALGTPMLLQPLIPAIETEGEWSLFIFNGVYSHAIVKNVAKGDFRVQSQHGGWETMATAPAAARAAADIVLAAIGTPLLYARVDLIADGRGGYMLMELELIEPQLFLEYAPDKGAIFAQAVQAMLG